MKTDTSAGRFARPDRLIGAMQSSATDPQIRIDCLQHAMDAWRKLREILKANRDPPDD